MSKQVFDGSTKIKVINVLGMFRNNSEYLGFLFKRFEEWESVYDIEFRFFFMENNSSDDTRAKLLEFVKTRKRSKVILYNLKNDYVNIDDGRNYNRIHTLAKLRNKLIDSITPLPSNEWCIFVDSNIYFSTEIIEKVFSYEIHDQVGMICVYTQQLLLPDVHIPNIKEPVLMNHFYDTYSFLDQKNKSFYPHCAFQKCPICTDNQKTDTMHTRIPKDLDIVEVHSCFGGFVFIKSDIFNDERIRWDTILYDLADDKCICEHYLFCDRLRHIARKKIIMLQHIDNIYRTI